MKKIFTLQLMLLCGIAMHAQNWLTTGNAVVSRNNFIGTTDTSAFIIKSGNVIGGVLYGANSNTSFGLGALAADAFVPNSTFIHVTHRGNSAFGYQALANNQSIQNTGVGFHALYGNTTGTQNTSVGYNSLSRNVSGVDNTAVGVNAAAGITTAQYTTALGAFALQGTTISSDCTAIGFYAGGNYEGWDNVFVGANTGMTGPNFFNVVAVGQGTTVTASNQVRLGVTTTTSIGGYVGWSNLSDGRYKTDIKSNVKGLDFIMKLNPVTYHLNVAAIENKLHAGEKREANPYQEKAIKEKENTLYTGFVAQEVEKAAKDAGFDFSGVDKPKNANDFYGLRYAEFVVPLVKSVQEQQQMINELSRQNAELLKRVDELEKKAGQAPSKEDLTIYPNPANDKVFINITATGASNVQVKLYDSKGSLLKQKNASVVAGTNEVSLDISDLPKGVFVMSAEWDNGKIKRSGELVK